jgi:hypothetical protein
LVAYNLCKKGKANAFPFFCLLFFFKKTAVRLVIDFSISLHNATWVYRFQVLQCLTQADTAAGTTMPDTSGYSSRHHKARGINRKYAFLFRSRFRDQAAAVNPKGRRERAV